MNAAEYRWPRWPITSSRSVNPVTSKSWPTLDRLPEPVEDIPAPFPFGALGPVLGRRPGHRRPCAGT